MIYRRLISRALVLAAIISFSTVVHSQPVPTSTPLPSEWVALPKGVNVVKYGPDGYLLIDWQNKSAAAVKNADYETKGNVSRFRAGSLRGLFVKGEVVPHAEGKGPITTERRRSYCLFGDQKCCWSDRYLGHCAAISFGVCSDDDDRCNRQ